MAKFEALFEDENDIFTGSAKSKFFDIMRNASNEVVEDEIEKIFERYAVMELMLSEKAGEEFDINRVLDEYAFKNSQKVDDMKKGLFMEFTGEIITRLDS